MRTDVDISKLERLRLDLEEKRAALFGLGRSYQDERDNVTQLVMSFAVCHAARVHWRPGDDPAVFLELPSKDQNEFKFEVGQARVIVKAREAMQAVRRRQDALTPRLNALTQLVAACDRYVQGA